MSDQGIDRRSFIALSGAAVAGLATSRLHAQIAPARIVSVGYHALQARSRAVGVANRAVLLDATSLVASEPSFMRTGARLSIHGNAPRSAVAVDVHHRADLVEGKVVFHAWSSASSGVSFNAPVELQQTLDIAITVDKVRTVFPFTVGNADGAIKLNSGQYIFAVSDRRPSWSSLWMDKLVLKSTDGRDVDFDYVVMSVASQA